MFSSAVSKNSKSLAFFCLWRIGEMGTLGMCVPSLSTFCNCYRPQWRIQDFPEEGAPTLQGGCQHTILPNVPQKCMKLKEFGPGGGGARPKFYYVDLPLLHNSSCRNVMFLPVCMSFCSGGCLLLGPGVYTPKADTPPSPEQTHPLPLR